MKSKLLINTIVSGIVVCSAPAYAAITVNTHAFNGVASGAIVTTDFADWGYVSSSNTGFFDSNLGGAGASYNNTPFGSITRDEADILTTVSGASSIGAVTLTEGTSGTNTVDAQSNISNYTFDGNTAYGSYGNFGPTEPNVWQMTFNDLGIGEFLISLYMGHSNNNRVFDMDISFDGGATTEDTTTSGGAISGLGSTVAAYGSSGSAFTYDINVTTTDALDDLTLTFGGTGGTTGGAIFAGYAVTYIPEPSTSVLFGLAGMVFFLRRRR